MQLRFRSHENINRKDRDILDSLNLPEVEPFFIIPEITGLKSDTEDIHLLCIHKKVDGREEMTKKRYVLNDLGLFKESKSPYEGSKIRKIKHIDIKEIGSDSTASASIDANTINKQCPSKNWHRVWFHTHNQSISAQSLDDRFATQNINSNDIGDTMCSVGINGVTCHFPSSNPPAISFGSWKKSFWNMMKEYNKSLNFLSPIKNMDRKLELSNELEAKVDQLLCYTSINNGKMKYNCSGRNWENGIQTFPIGIFDNVYFDGSTDTFGNSIISIPKDEKYECVSINNQSTGGKLICH